MSLVQVRKWLVTRLEEGDRGDRGWFITTRVHVAVAWLKSITEFLLDRGASRPIKLTENDYQRLGQIIESDNADPGVQLRRHHLLVMDKPLHLIRRVHARNWTSGIYLTTLGQELAQSVDPAQVLEKALNGIRFAVEPWSPKGRVTEYAEFDVHAYQVTRSVLQRCNGVLDRDEFDFFLSRIRHEGEVEWAVDCIHAYRDLQTRERANLHYEVRSRVPGTEKSYQNWRDVALHTFSLFGLGISMIREQQRLLLMNAWTTEQTGLTPREPVITTHTATPELLMPEPPEVEHLLTPPAAPASNTGSDAESFVAKVLRSNGWEVVFYTNRRGYGFDLWARRGILAMVIEVKSSLGELGTVTLTSTEYRAAQKHGESYFLALVENIESDQPRLRMIQNPIARTEVQRRDTVSYVISRSEWLRAATQTG